MTLKKDRIFSEKRCLLNIACFAHWRSSGDLSLASSNIFGKEILWKPVFMFITNNNQQIAYNVLFICS